MHYKVSKVQWSILRPSQCPCLGLSRKWFNFSEPNIKLRSRSLQCQLFREWRVSKSSCMGLHGEAYRDLVDLTQDPLRNSSKHTCQPSSSLKDTLGDPWLHFFVVFRRFINSYLCDGSYKKSVNCGRASELCAAGLVVQQYVFGELESQLAWKELVLPRSCDLVSWAPDRLRVACNVATVMYGQFQSQKPQLFNIKTGWAGIKGSCRASEATISRLLI